MSALTFYLGEKGNAGANGINGLGVADITAPPVNEPLCSLFFNNLPSQSAVLSSTRDYNALYVDRYGFNEWARTQSITNYLTYSNDFTQWTDTFGRWTRIGATTDPFGGNDATEINLDVDTDVLGGSGQVITNTISGIAADDIVTVSFYMKVISGEVSSLDFTVTPIGGRNVVNVPSNDWVRVVYPYSPTSIPTLFDLNPRGKTGARIAIYEVQIENGNTASDIIHTNNNQVTVNNPFYQIRESDRGVLIEGAKTNLVHDSNNLSNWTLTDCTTSPYQLPDAFSHIASNVSVDFATIINVSLEGDTDALVEDDQYSVSFYAFLNGGSMQSFSVTLGDGDPIELAIPSVLGFVRYSVKCIAGATEKIRFNAESGATNALLKISGVQVETGDLSSFILTQGQAETRAADTISMPHEYNFPAPNLDFTLSFRIYNLIDSTDKKYIFSNGLTTTSEFSLYFEDRNLVLNNGGNLASVDMFNYNQIGLIYDGTNLKFYNERTLIDTVAQSSGTTIGTTVYIGYNGTDGHINANLSNILAFNAEFSDNDMVYLQGL